MKMKRKSMERQPRRRLAAVMAVVALALCIGFAACGNGEPTGDANAPNGGDTDLSQEANGEMGTDGEPTGDAETIQGVSGGGVQSGDANGGELSREEIYERMVELFGEPDFSRYKTDPEFSLLFTMTADGSDAADVKTLSLYEKAEKQPLYFTPASLSKKAEELLFWEDEISSDGMAVYDYKWYGYDLDSAGRLIVNTHYYWKQDVQYIDYLWTDMALDYAKTHRGIGVGSSADELKNAYTEDLYYLEGPIERDNLGAQWDEYDCAYFWQPFKDNDIRDITFYVNDGIVAAVEMCAPYELRYVYGYDREQGLVSR